MVGVEVDPTGGGDLLNVVELFSEKRIVFKLQNKNNTFYFITKYKLD